MHSINNLLSDMLLSLPLVYLLSYISDNCSDKQSTIQALAWHFSFIFCFFFFSQQLTSFQFIAKYFMFQWAKQRWREEKKHEQFVALSIKNLLRTSAIEEREENSNCILFDLWLSCPSVLRQLSVISINRFHNKSPRRLICARCLRWLVFFFIQSSRFSSS